MKTKINILRCVRVVRSVVLICLTSGLALAASVLAAAPPNILFLVADDLNCALACYGDPVAVTPNLDRLAARGLVFELAYCQQAVCNPSRSSFLTGLRPDTVGVDDLRKSFRETAPDGMDLVTLPQHFKNQGWFCQNIGKLFHNMGDTQDRRSWSIDEAFFRGTHADDTVFANAASPPGWTKPEYKAPVTEAPELPDTTYRDGQIAELAAAVLRQYPNDGQPFFLAVGFWRPHLPFVAPKRYWDLYDPDDIPLPDPAVAPEGVPAIALHPSREIRGYGLVPKGRDFTEQEIRHYRHGYYASISFLDAQVGKILDALRDGGHADKTLVVFTSDHGFHIGEHALWGKTSNFELDARVPLIIADPCAPAGHGRKTRALAELVDLYPTLAHRAGIAQSLPGNLEGDDLSPVIADPDKRVKDAAFTQHQQPFYGNPKDWQAWGYSVRTNRWRYTEWRAIQSDEIIARELYDHENDPSETRNLAQDRAHTEVLEAHAAWIAGEKNGHRRAD
jgi:iduronate 2-sulfatase